MKAAPSSWVRPSEDFVSAPDCPPPESGGSTVLRFFRERETNARWLGKAGSHAVMYNREFARYLQQERPEFISRFADEILEKLGLAIYQMLGTRTPQSVLSFQKVPLEVELENECECLSPRMHHLSRFIEDLHPLGACFVEQYLAKAKDCGDRYVEIEGPDGEWLPLKGLGTMLASAALLGDLDCLGDYCNNAGYIIEEKFGQRYAQLVKIDAGCAFYYSELRYDRNDDPINKKVFISPGDAYRVFDFTMRYSNQGVEKFNEAVLDWVKAVQEAIEVYQLTQYEVNAPWVFVGTALQALERGLWEEFVEDPKRYGVPSELLATLVEYKEQHPVLLTIIDNPELSNQWYTNLVQRKCSEISHLPKADLTEKELVEEKSSRWCMVS